jgi:VIT1/CCC1 family predicted Fe2+/Mn2+ transporter
MLEDPDHALDVLAREELGLNPDDLGSAAGAATFSFGAFSAGAVLPLLPFLLGRPSVPVAALVAAIGLFSVGAVLSLFTGRHALRGGMRMLSIGAGAGVLTYLLGTWLGSVLA